MGNPEALKAKKPKPEPEDGSDEGRPLPELPRLALPNSYRAVYTSGKELLAREVAGEIRALRSAYQETLRRFNRRVETRLTELERVFDQESDDPLEADLPSPKVALELLALLGEISMKPARGRVKDLAKVQDFLEFAEETVPKRWFHALPDAEED